MNVSLSLCVCMHCTLCSRKCSGCQAKKGDRCGKYGCECRLSVGVCWNKTKIWMCYFFFFFSFTVIESLFRLGPHGTAIWQKTIFALPKTPNASVTEVQAAVVLPCGLMPLMVMHFLFHTSAGWFTTWCTHSSKQVFRPTTAPCQKTKCPHSFQWGHSGPEQQEFSQVQLLLPAQPDSTFPTSQCNTVCWSTVLAKSNTRKGPNTSRNFW